MLSKHLRSLSLLAGRQEDKASSSPDRLETQKGEFSDFERPGADWPETLYVKGLCG